MSSLVPTLKRSVAVPGTFAAVFPNTQDSDLVGACADAFGYAQLQGFFANMSLQATDQTDTDWQTMAGDPTIPNSQPVAVDISGGAAALIILCATVNIIQSQLRNIKTQERYRSGDNEYEIQRGATILKEALSEANTQLSTLVTLSRQEARHKGTLATVFDVYRERNVSQILVSEGFFPWELGYLGVGLDVVFPVWN